MAVVRYEKRDRIAYVTLNRPESLNAVNLEVSRELARIWREVRDDPEVWTVIVTGTGQKAFSAGYDLKEVSQGRAAAEKEGRPFVLPVLDMIWPMRGLEVWKPFIAAVNGIAFGAGLELAMACDIRIAAEHASFGLPEVRQAIIPAGGGTQRLPRLIPFGIALEAIITGDPISAQDALRLGLVNRVVPGDKVMETAEALARRINENGPLAVRAAKESVYRGARMPLDEALRLETLLEAKTFLTEDAAEGPRAFSEKRKPQYKGR
ncbi:MAG: enoyl-CoA hydratase-related protein [Chloroflexota bacterium]